jgi:hypothetical protein
MGPTQGLFDIKQFQNSRGVIRRRMSLERNLREAGWPFDWSDPRRRFHFFFDAFCYRWKLYGMEHRPSSSKSASTLLHTAP